MSWKCSSAPSFFITSAGIPGAEKKFRFNQRTYGAGWDEVELIGREESEGGEFLQRKLDPGPYIPYLLRAEGGGQKAGQRRRPEGGSAGPNQESEQEEDTRMEEVPALAL
ncbi:hypothetical protein Acr_00g0003230 [Actinidia rufa]|uniref:Uncharacterized protein n=1 Tax=Actinidia rufa TaxID=165716 RepID=A0A7J0D8W3_9ERIC|nr:hypothetical protein Acr_00g0003230 [Actinidia rufa]